MLIAFSLLRILSHTWKIIKHLHVISVAVHRRHLAKVDATIVSRMRLRLLIDNNDVRLDRTRLKKVIYKNIFMTHGDLGFGIIIGPPGSGKTAVIRKLCNEYPRGSLYLEATNTEVPEELAKAIGFPRMVDAPTMEESMFSFINSIFHYRVTLPQDRKVALEHVLEILRERSSLSSDYWSPGDRVRLIIDGCDFIAKYQPELYKCLLDQAKVVVNEKAFNTILARVIEVGDVSNEDAEAFLRKMALFQVN